MQNVTIRKIASNFKKFIQVQYIYLYKYIFLRNLLKIEDISREDKSFFDETLKKIRKSGVSDLNYFKNDYEFEGGLLLQQNPYEYAALVTYLKKYNNFKVYLEIGSASGGSCRFLNENFNFGRIISLDDGRHPQAAHQSENFRNFKNFIQFLGDSHSIDAVNFLQKNLNEKIDIAFIDGDHGYEGVKQDLDLVLPFTKKGTLLIFHDTDPSASLGVARLWVSAIRNNKIKPIGEFIGQEIPLGIGIAEAL